MKGVNLRSVALVAIVGLVMAVLSVAPLQAAQQAQKKVYIAGVDADFPPFSWVEQGVHKGFDIDVMRAIGKIEGFKIKVESLPWSTIVTALGQGKINILMSGLSITPARAKVIEYSKPYWTLGQAILVRENSGLNAITAMSMGHTVGAEVGATGYIWVNKNLVKKGVNVKSRGYPTYQLAIDDLKSGRIDAVLLDLPTAEGFVNARRKFKIIGIIKTGEQYAYAVTKGDPYGLLPKINDGMAKLYANGTWVKLMHKYFPGTPIQSVPQKRTLIFK